MNQKHKIYYFIFCLMIFSTLLSNDKSKYFPPLTNENQPDKKIKIQTSQDNLAPIANPKRVQRAWGIILEKILN